MPGLKLKITVKTNTLDRLIQTIIHCTHVPNRGVNLLPFNTPHRKAYFRWWSRFSEWSLSLLQFGTASFSTEKVVQVQSAVQNALALICNGKASHNRALLVFCNHAVIHHIIAVTSLLHPCSPLPSQRYFNPKIYLVCKGCSVPQWEGNTSVKFSWYEGTDFLSVQVLFI